MSQEWWDSLDSPARSNVQNFIAEANRVYPNKPELAKTDCVHKFQLSDDQYEWIFRYLTEGQHLTMDEKVEEHPQTQGQVVPQSQGPQAQPQALQRALVQQPGHITDSLGPPAGPFHRMKAELTVGPGDEDDFAPFYRVYDRQQQEVIRVKPNHKQGASLFIPLDQKCFEEAHKYIARLQGAAPECCVHTNPSVHGLTGIFCDRRMPKVPVAKHAYLFNEVPIPLAQFQDYGMCRAPNGWTPCEWRAAAEDVQTYEPPDFDSENELLECACKLLDVIAGTKNFPAHLQFEAAYLAVYLHHHQELFVSLGDIVNFAGEHFRFAWRHYQAHPSLHLHDVYQALFDAAEEASPRCTEVQ